jgi:type IV pilus assembly protein PilE
MKTPHPAHPRAPRRPRGFTLIELMIAVAVVGILASLAYPSYTQYVLKSRRTEAKAALLDLAMRQERYFSMTNTYADAPDKLGYAKAAFPVEVLAGGRAYYQLSAQVGVPATSYSATATPLGGQVKDSCGTYSINQLGVQGNANNSSPVTACW